MQNILPQAAQRLAQGWLGAAIIIGVLGMSPIDELALAQGTSPTDTSGYARPTGSVSQSRSAVVAQHGIVATSEPLAAQVGLDVLKHGGNAVDAAIATNAMIGLTEPMSCGVGGDVFVIYWDAKTKKLYGLNGSGRSPYALSREVLKKRGITSIPDEGPLPWSVPGCVAGWQDLSDRFGTMTLAEVLDAPTRYAEEGFPVSQIIARGWQASAADLSQWEHSAKTYLPDGRAPEMGEIFRNPDLAATYRAISAGGAKAFYEGETARRIVEYSEKIGGYLSLRDFADHTSTWVEPVSTSFRGYQIWELPPNGQGIAALQILNLLEPYDLRSLGHNSAEYLHLFIEAKKLAFADRARFYADPEMADVPVDELISKSYADKRRKLIDPNHAAKDVPHGDPQLAHGDTIYLTVVDKDRNCCSFIQSNYYGFGSSVVAGRVGFVMQNRGALFTLQPDHPNTLEPHKRPFHTIIPAMATKDGRPWLSFGVMGGDMQPQGHVQVLLNMIEFGMDVQQAGDAARVRHLGSQTPTGQPMASGGGTVAVERGVSDDVIEQLRAKGHQVHRAVGSFGGYQAIMLDHEHGTIAGGSDPRKDGAAVGY